MYIEDLIHGVARWPMNKRLRFFVELCVFWGRWISSYTYDTMVRLFLEGFFCIS